MRKWTKRAVYIVMTIIFLMSQASLALARAGGGKGGSLGGSSGRSFSGGLSGGGFSGGSSGGFGGFSFFPFFFWGGPSYGGGSIFGGLFSLLFLLFIIYLVLKTLRSSRRWSQGRPMGRGFGQMGRGFGPMRRGFGSPYDEEPKPVTRTQDYSEDLPVDLKGRPITNSEEAQRFAKAISFTRENMTYYAQTFPRWDRDYIVARVKQVFFWFQDAWARQDLSDSMKNLSPGLAAEYHRELQDMMNRGERNIIKEPVLETGDIEFIHSHLGEDSQHFIAMIFASLIDYTVDAQGRVVSGDQNHRLYFTEFWEFVWQDDRWVLTRIYQEDALEIAKLARGDDQ